MEMPTSINPAVDRYRRQTAFASLGKAGQEKLANSKVAIVGIGALGSVIAERLGRAGVGELRLIDRDWVEWDNLARQTLFDEADAASRHPKADAAARRLATINRTVRLAPVVADLTPKNASELLGDVELILDGTDNFETRFLVNDVALEYGIPWIHAGCVGASGQGMVCIPGETACFRCLLPEPMPPEQQATCDSVGVLGPAISMVAGWQAMEAVKLLSGNYKAVCRSLVTFDFWYNDTRYLRLDPNDGEPGCPACKQGLREFLDGSRFTSTQILCGRNAVQLHNTDGRTVDLEKLADRLKGLGKVVANPFLVRFESSMEDGLPFTLTVFRDGRSIVSGTEDPIVARRLVATWIGS
jgi:adenylyltransferase/sulfurtransferase